MTRLAQRFPFIFRLLNRNQQQSGETQGNSLPDKACTSDEIDSPEEMRNLNAVDVISEGSNKYSEEVQTTLSNYNEFHSRLTNFLHSLNLIKIYGQSI